MQAKTGIGAFLIYCWAAIPLTFLTEVGKKKFDIGVFGRAAVYGLIFMGVEFLTGFFAKYVCGGDPGWDYSNLPLNMLGLTAFSLFPIWMLVGGIAEFFHNRLTQIDDVLINPVDLNTEEYIRGYLKRKYGIDN
jgi:hypothetical protein